MAALFCTFYILYHSTLLLSIWFVIVNMVCYKKKQRKCAAEMGYNISPERMMCKKNVAVLVFGIHYGTSNQFGYEII